MSAFQLDTSGLIDFGPHPEIALSDPFKYTRYIGFDDLDPFTQGYIEAALADLDKARMANYQAERRAGRPCAVPIRPAYCWLAPETLATIIEDCAKITKSGRNDLGRAFWLNRQKGLYERCPPLTVTLSDAGKVRFQ